jgi:hypothetical protein
MLTLGGSVLDTLLMPRPKPHASRVCVETTALIAPAVAALLISMNPQGPTWSRDYQECPWAGGHARAMKILVPTLRFVARASRRAASTAVSTFFSAVTAIRLEIQREIIPYFRRSGRC